MREAVAYIERYFALAKALYGSIVRAGSQLLPSWEAPRVAHDQLPPLERVHGWRESAQQLENKMIWPKSNLGD